MILERDVVAWGMAPFTVQFSLIPADADTPATWVASCDALGLVTEAESYDVLVERVWQIAPEMAVINGLTAPDATIGLRFVADMDAPGRYIVAA